MENEKLIGLANSLRGASGGTVAIPASDADSLGLSGVPNRHGLLLVNAAKFVDAVDRIILGIDSFPHIHPDDVSHFQHFPSTRKREGGVNPSGTGISF